MPTFNEKIEFIMQYRGCSRSEAIAVLYNCLVKD